VWAKLNATGAGPAVRGANSAGSSPLKVREVPMNSTSGRPGAASSRRRSRPSLAPYSGSRTPGTASSMVAISPSCPAANRAAPKASAARARFGPGRGGQGSSAMGSSARGGGGAVGAPADDGEQLGEVAVELLAMIAHRRVAEAEHAEEAAQHLRRQPPPRLLGQALLRVGDEDHARLGRGGGRPRLPEAAPQP